MNLIFKINRILKMNTFINRSKIVLVLLAVTLLVGITACDVNDPDLPFDLDGTLSNNGAYLRVLTQQPFDIAEGTDASYTLTFEYYDGKDESLLEDVEFFVDYTAFSLDQQNDPDFVEVDETDSPFLTIPASEFSENDDGLPQASVEIPITTVLDALGLDINEIEVEDNFGVRWSLNTTDGRTFSVEDRSPAVAGGFYGSPYFANVNVLQAIPTDMFVGEYEFVQTTPGQIVGPLFAETFTAELEVDPDAPLNGRVFSQAPLQGWGTLDPVEVPLAFGQTASINSNSAIGTGLTCGAGITFGPASSDLVLIDIEDDSEFTLVIQDNANTDCGVAPYNIVLEATKV